MTAHLSLAGDLARRAEGKQRARLSASVSEVAGLAAWRHADLAEPVQARHFYKMSIAAAQQAQYPLLAIYMQGSFGQYATTAGDPIHGLRLLRDAAARLPRSAPNTARAWLAALEGVALGYLGDREALKLLDGAQRHADADSGADPVWPWVFQFDSSKIASYRAIAAGRLGLTKIAAEAFDQADGASPQSQAGRARDGRAGTGAGSRPPFRPGVRPCHRRLRHRRGLRIRARPPGRLRLPGQPRRPGARTGHRRTGRPPAHRLRDTAT